MGEDRGQRGSPSSEARTPPPSLVHEALGAAQIAFDVLRVLGTNGIFVFTGVPARKGPIQLDSDLLMRNIVLKNQVVVGSINAGREDSESAIRDLGAFEQRWPEALRALISGRCPMSEVESLLAGRRDGIKKRAHDLGREVT